MSIPQFLKLPAVEIITSHYWYEGRRRVWKDATRRFEVSIDPISIRFMESDGAFTRTFSKT